MQYEFSNGVIPDEQPGLTADYQKLTGLSPSNLYKSLRTKSPPERPQTTAAIRPKSLGTRQGTFLPVNSRAFKSPMTDSLNDREEPMKNRFAPMGTLSSTQKRAFGYTKSNQNTGVTWTPIGVASQKLKQH